VGADTAVNWPTGIGAKGNAGVAGNVQQVAGSIGYVEYAYVVQNKMTYALVENAAGDYPAPSVTRCVSLLAPSLPAVTGSVLPGRG